MRHVVLIGLGLLAGCHRPPAADTGTEPARRPAASVPAAAPAPSPVGTVDLGGYVGRYPFDKVAGVTFLDQPAIRAAIAATVPDDAVRAFIRDPDATAVPIVRRGGKLLASACEPHDCGPHFWTMLIATNGTGGEICVHDDDGARPTRWFVAGREVERAAGCPSNAGM